MPRYTLAALLCLAAATPAWALPATIPASAVLTEQQAVMPPSGPYVVSIKNVRGPVLVRTWNKNVVYVKAEKKATHPISGSEAQLYQGTAVSFERPSSDTVALTTTFPVGDKAVAGVTASRTPHVEVAYTVMVPPMTALSLDQEAGRVTVVGLDGRATIFTRDGEVAVSNTHGRVEVGNERGDLKLSGIDGDVIADTMHGQIYVERVTGDLEAKTASGSVWVTVPPRFSADVSFHTVRGDFRSDLATVQTDMNPGEAGYVGRLRGPLAMGGAPDLRYCVDTVSGTLQIAGGR